MNISSILRIFFFFTVLALEAAQGADNKGYLTDVLPPAEEEREFPSILLSPSLGFAWLIPGIIAGMAQPPHTEEMVKALAQANIGAIISLNDDRWATPHESRLLELYAIKHHSYSLPDPWNYSPSQLPLLHSLLHHLTRLSKDLWEQHRKGIVIHCEMGVSRTGTVLACWLLLHTATLENNLLEPRQRGAVAIQANKAITQLNKICDIGTLIGLQAVEKTEKNFIFLKTILEIRNPALVEITTSLSSSFSPTTPTTGAFDTRPNEIPAPQSLTLYNQQAAVPPRG